MTGIQGRIDRLEQQIGGDDSLLELQIIQAAAEFEQIFIKRVAAGDCEGWNFEWLKNQTGSDRTEDPNAYRA